MGLSRSCSRSGSPVGRSTRPRRRSARRPLLVAVLAALFVTATACGSDPTPTGSAAGAKENAAGAGCTDWTSGAPVTCAVNTRGPGGGRVFHDAGSVQPWGRFLEVAPQLWNSQDPVNCPESVLWASTCGSDGTVPEKTVDVTKDSNEHTICSASSSQYTNKRPIAGPAATTGTAVGAGRNNTAVLLAATDCTVAGSDTALTMAAAYRGGGLADWYLGSKDEMTLLCHYDGRNAIGGFFNSVVGDGVNTGYATSTAYVDTSGAQNFVIQIMNVDQDCPTRPRASESIARESFRIGVRPIRAF